MLLKVTEMMKNQFGLKPKGLTFSYKRPYPEWYDLVTLPTNYKLPEFTKFTVHKLQAPKIVQAR